MPNAFKGGSLVRTSQPLLTPAGVILPDTTAKILEAVEAGTSYRIRLLDGAIQGSFTVAERALPRADILRPGRYGRRYLRFRDAPDKGWEPHDVCAFNGNRSPGKPCPRPGASNQPV